MAIPTRITFLHNDLFKDAVVESYSAVITLPADNAKNPLVDKVYRSKGQSTSEFIKWDLGSAKALDYVTLIGHNLTYTCDITVEGSASSDFSTPFSTTFTGDISGTTNTQKTKVTTVFFTSSQTYRYWRIRPTSNFTLTEGYIEIGRIMCGLKYESDKTQSWGWEHRRIDLSSKKRIGTYSLTDKRVKRNQFSFNISFFDYTSKLELLSVFDYIGISEDIVICFDPSTSQFLRDLSFYGQLEELPGFINPQPELYTLSNFSFVESVGDGNFVTITNARGLFGGGCFTGGTAITTIDYINIAIIDNTYNFGDLNTARLRTAALASATRGVFIGGTNSYEGSVQIRTMEYVTISIANVVSNFGSISQVYGPTTNSSTCASLTRGIFAGMGSYIGTYFITIANLGNSLRWGDLPEGGYSSGGGCGNTITGIVSEVDPLNLITQFISLSIASLDSCSNFGTMSAMTQYMGACASATRGVFGGGMPYDSITDSVLIMNYFGISWGGTASVFGDLTIARTQLQACASATRGVFGGGTDVYEGVAYSTLDYIYIASTGVATEFGDLLSEKSSMGACANQGGL